MHRDDSEESDNESQHSQNTQSSAHTQQNTTWYPRNSYPRIHSNQSKSNTTSTTINTPNTQLPRWRDRVPQDGSYSRQQIHDHYQQYLQEMDTHQNNIPYTRQQRRNRRAGHELYLQHQQAIRDTLYQEQLSRAGPNPFNITPNMTL